MAANFGGAVSDLFGAFGDFEAANAYGKEAKIAEQNATLTEVSGAVTEAQTARAVTLAKGTEEAGTAAGGFSTSGSGGDLMRMTLQQGALQKGLVTNQTAITAAGFEQQAEAAKGQEQAANTKGAGGLFGGVLSLFGL